MTSANDKNQSQNPRPRIGTDGTVFKCPICKTILPGTSVPTFPFCSDRCRLLDLDNWMTGSYTLSRPLDPTDNLEDNPGGAGPPQQGRSGV